MDKRNRSNEGTGKKRSGGNVKNATGGVRELLETLKAHKVLSFKGEGVEIVLSPMAYMDEIDMTKFELTDAQRKQIDSDDLYYSVGGKQ